MKEVRENLVVERVNKKYLTLEEWNDRHEGLTKDEAGAVDKEIILREFGHWYPFLWEMLDREASHEEGQFKMAMMLKNLEGLVVKNIGDF